MVGHLERGVSRLVHPGLEYVYPNYQDVSNHLYVNLFLGESVSKSGCIFLYYFESLSLCYFEELSLTHLTLKDSQCLHLGILSNIGNVRIEVIPSLVVIYVTHHTCRTHSTHTTHTMTDY